jgi:hypothetical protein
VQAQVRPSLHQAQPMDDGGSAPLHERRGHGSADGLALSVPGGGAAEGGATPQEHGRQVEEGRQLLVDSLQMQLQAAAAAAGNGAEGGGGGERDKDMACESPQPQRDPTKPALSPSELLSPQRCARQCP